MEATAQDIIKFLGKVGVFHTNRFQVFVKIIDINRKRTRVSFLITPVTGTGSRWVLPHELFVLTDSFGPHPFKPEELYIPGI